VIGGGQDDFTFFHMIFWGGIGRGDFIFWDGDYLKGFFCGWHGREKFGWFSR
jgi:hypothetical protein